MGSIQFVFLTFSNNLGICGKTTFLNNGLFFDYFSLTFVFSTNSNNCSIKIDMTGFEPEFSGMGTALSTVPQPLPLHYKILIQIILP